MKLTVTHYDNTSTFEIPEHSTCYEFFRTCRAAAHAVGYASETIEREFLPDDALSAFELAERAKTYSDVDEQDVEGMFDVIFTPDFPINNG